LTQQQVAEPAYTPAYVSTIEAGRRAPSEDALDHFAQKLGISADELTSGVPSSFQADATLRLQEGWRYLYLGSYAEAKKCFISVEKDARRYGRVVLRARAIEGVARCAERQGQTADALEGCTRARRLLEGAAPLPAAVEAVAGIARCHQMSGDPRLAAHILESYLFELERQELLDPTALMRVYASLVWPYMELGLHQRANEVAQQALRLETRVHEPVDIAGMHLNVARVLLSKGEVDAALDSLRKAEEIFRDLNWQTEIARARTNRGMVFMSEGDLEAARDELQAALQTFQEVGFVRGEGRTLNELARLERLLGRPEAGRDLATRALELLSDMAAVPEQALAERELALCLREDAPDQAEKHFRAAIDLYKECQELMHAADTHRLLGDLLARAGRSDEACTEYRSGLLAIGEGLDRSDP
jgi:tetratricopeptide (TPR) repeat protein